jgi:SAM-dependent methyltransferase
LVYGFPIKVGVYLTYGVKLGLGGKIGRMNVHKYNRRAWDKYVNQGNEFTKPVDPELIEYARGGEWAIFLSPGRPAPQDCFPKLAGLDILCLGGGGGQQGPIMAAAGGRVTVLDISPRQLAQDRAVAEREELEITIVEGDMSDLSMFESASFDLIVNPISNLYIPKLDSMWKEAYRVLRPGGILAAAFMNPVFYIFDRQKLDATGEFVVRHSLPYSDIESLSEYELQKIEEAGWPLEFSHTLEDQIGGQLASGFVLVGMYEDRDPRGALYEITPVYIATRAIKPV